MANDNFKATRNPDGSWTFEHVRIGLKNFRGEESPFNKAGNRNFCIFFEGHDEVAHEMENDCSKNGDPWLIKWTKPNEEGESTAYLPCNINVSGNFKFPTIWLIPENNPGNKVEITKDNLSVLDSFDWITMVDGCADVTIRPYDWTFRDNGRHGRKAMVDELFVVMHRSSLQDKYDGDAYADESLPF